MKPLKERHSYSKHGHEVTTQDVWSKSEQIFKLLQVLSKSLNLTIKCFKQSVLQKQDPPGICRNDKVIAWGSWHLFTCTTITSFLFVSTSCLWNVLINKVWLTVIDDTLRGRPKNTTVCPIRGKGVCGEKSFKETAAKRKLLRQRLKEFSERNYWDHKSQKATTRVLEGHYKSKIRQCPLLEVQYSYGLCVRFTSVGFSTM